MEFSLKFAQRIAATLVTAIFILGATPLAADSYRWKDKDGNVHYGASVPAEYAKQPYDILNNAGIVIEHVEDTTISVDELAEQKTLSKKPLISDEDRQDQADRLLVIQYRSEEEILTALELQVAQLGYDSKLIDQSFESTSTAIRDQVKQAADRQRAGQPVSEDKIKEINKLYARRRMDEKKRVSLNVREARIRERFQKDLDRYRFLTTEHNEAEEQQADQG